MSVFFALRDAIAACGDANARPVLRAPATPEAILAAVGTTRRGLEIQRQQAAE
jgi:xanthine dehydrogenase large subunit